MTREELLAKKKAYRESHKDEIQAYREENRDIIRLQNKEYRKKHRFKILTQQAAYRVVNRNKCRLWDKQWKTLNKDKIRSYRNTFTYKERKALRERERRKTDINFAITKRLRGRFRAALKQNSKRGSAIKDLGCSIEEFKKYIESKFQGGMSWENRDKWHFDHIIPLSKFNLQDPQQIKIALHYTNYQPMWAHDNILKNDFHILDFRNGIF